MMSTADDAKLTGSRVCQVFQMLLSWTGTADNAKLTGVPCLPGVSDAFIVDRCTGQGEYSR